MLLGLVGSDGQLESLGLTGKEFEALLESIVLDSEVPWNGESSWLPETAGWLLDKAVGATDVEISITDPVGAESELKLLWSEGNDFDGLTLAAVSDSD